MKKRILSLLLAAAMLFSLGSVAFAADRADLQLSAPQTLPAVGQTFTVSVDISQNPGFSAMELVLQYNPAVVKCEKAETGTAASSMLSASNKTFTANSAKVAAASAATQSQDGSIATFTFRVLASGDAGFALTDVLLTDEADREVVTTENRQQPTPAQNDQRASEQQTAAAENQQSDSEAAMIPAGRFKDVPPTYWGYAQIERAAQLSLVAGFSDGTFAPEQSVTRAQFVLMLWRMANKPQPKTAASFTDAKADWYQDALCWASENGYVTGTGGGRFNPDGKITRQEAMSILFRYSGSESGMETMFTSTYDNLYSDSGMIAAWAKPAVYWAVYKSLLTGVGENLIAPTRPATRAQIAVILLRYMDKIAIEEEPT